ncbi:MAG: hypothetical protein ACREUU_14000, partial [Gammaproteobacteria bacterium]
MKRRKRRVPGCLQWEECPEMRPVESRLEDRPFIFLQLGVRNSQSIQTRKRYRMNSFCFSNGVAVGVVPSHFWR